MMKAMVTAVGKSTSLNLMKMRMMRSSLLGVTSA